MSIESITLDDDLKISTLYPSDDNAITRDPYEFFFALMAETFPRRVRDIEMDLDFERLSARKFGQNRFEPVIRYVMHTSIDA